MSDVKRIVLTGGPCGGKTTALARIRERLESHGYKVMIVPEVASLVIPGACLDMQGMTRLQQFQFELEVLALQDQFEESFSRLASTVGPAVIILDRGLMDIAGFVSDDMFEAILSHRKGGVHAHRDMYDAVVHIVTAADGAEEFYSLDNNVARTETIEQAREIDRNLRRVWTGTPHLRVIDNSTSFDVKMNRVVGAVCGVVGIPEPLEVERRYLVSRVDDFPSDVVEVDIQVTQHYLLSEPGESARVRQRGAVFTYCVKLPGLDPSQRVEKERMITAREYYTLLEQRDPSCSPIRKTRKCFTYCGRYFELDTFHDAHEGLVMLEVELDAVEDVDDLTLPPWVHIERDVTDDRRFNNHALAARGGVG